MTSATSATSTRKSVRRGFTLVELLVVIGIIVILISLLLPVIVRAVRQGKRTRAASDLNAIAAALEAYKQDFYDYPRIIYNSTTPYDGTGSGASLLGKALLGMGDAVTATWSSTPAYVAGQIVHNATGPDYAAVQAVPAGNSPPNATYWTPLPMSAADGADGPGFRLRAAVPPASPTGQIKPPYLQPDKFKTLGLAIVDGFGNPILYYAANPARPVVTVNATAANFGAGNNYLGTAMSVIPEQAVSAAPTTPCQSLYNYSDNDTVALNASGNPTDFIPTFPDITALEAMLGIYDFNAYPGYIGPGETPASTAAYLLWSAGPDGQYGPVSSTSAAVSNFKSLQPTDVKKLVNQCDDVTNFTFAQ